MTYSRPWMYCGLTFMAVGALLLWQQHYQPSAQAEPPKTPAKPAADPVQWKDLFDGKTLKGWKTPQFGGEGKVYVKDGTIVMDMGSMMTGVTYTGEVTRDNYELELEGMRLGGSDFFCTTTFPVGKDSCSLVVGGWGGGVVGLSSIDYADASENATTKTMSFKDNKWYKVRIRVSDAAIEAWIDNQKTVNQPRKDHKIGIRMECDSCRPLGISTWCTKGAVRNIRVRSLRPEEVRAAEEQAKRAAENE
jgi:hypothetical protein